MTSLSQTASASRGDVLFAWPAMYVAVPVFFGFLFGWLGISGSDQWPLAVAVAVWTLVVFVDWALAGGMTALLARLSFAVWLPFWALLMLGLGLSKFIAMPVNHVLADTLDALGYATTADRTMAGSVLTAIVPQAIVWVAANYLVLAIKGEPAAAVAAMPAPPPQTFTPVPISQSPPDSVEPRFMTRVRPAIRGPILAIRAEQHYIRVHTEHGEDLILYKFGDAVREIDRSLGMQVHRSWWVARAAVGGPAHAGRDALLLSSGLEVPIGRTYLREARVLLGSER